jgi:hypothetical protein
VAGRRPARGLPGALRRSRELQARFIAGIAQRHSAKPDRDARLVHHVEYAAVAFAGLADEITDRSWSAAYSELALAEVQQRVRTPR